MAPPSQPGLALLGAGIFARSAWAPVLRAAAAEGLLTITAAWSRSAESASALAADLDVPAFHGDAGLISILADPLTTAVLVCLPVQAMPEVVARALRAGKAVLQEKPVAPTVEAATAVAQVAAGLSSSIWALAENYRSEPGVAALAAAASASSIGPAIKLDLTANMPMNETNRYHGSTWRRDTAGCPGGFLMDSAVHFLAALRAAAGGAGWGEPVSGTAVAFGADDPAGSLPLPAPDTLVGHLVFANGRAASLSITFAGALPSLALSVEGRAGAARLGRGGFGGGGGPPSRGAGYTLDTADGASTFHAFEGLDAELRSFLRLVEGKGTPADGLALSPAAAARDLAAIEALLASSAAGGVPVAVKALPGEPWAALEGRGGRV